LNKIINLRIVEKATLAWLLVSLQIPSCRAEPVTFTGETISILHDGSPTAYNPHSEAGRILLQTEREACCVEAPKGFQGRTGPFAFNADQSRNLPHKAVRFVLNSRTGAFLSSTTLQDEKFPRTDPRRYVDTDETPAVALSDEQIKQCGCQPGDRVLVTDTQFKRDVWAVFAEDAGPQPAMALDFIQISPAAAAALLLPLDPNTRDLKHAQNKLSLTVYPGSGNGPHFPHGMIPPLRKSLP
jgi:hypothetical protein